MTRLSILHELVNQLDDDQAVAIIGLIDLKTEEDMDKVLNKLTVMENKFDTKFDAIEHKFDAMDSKFTSMIQSIRWWNASVIGLVSILFIIMRYFPH